MHAPGATGARPGFSTSACGPAVEVQRFLRECEESDLAEIDLLDFNAETLVYTRQRIQEARMFGGRETHVRYFQRSVHQLLRAASAGRRGGIHQLRRRLLRGIVRLSLAAGLQTAGGTVLHHDSPGGIVIVTNVAASNPRKAWMEYVMEWNLIYRDTRTCMTWFPKGST